MTIRLFSNLSYEIEERILMFLDTYTIRMIVENNTFYISDYVWNRKKHICIGEASKNGNLIGLKYLVEKCMLNYINCSEEEISILRSKSEYINIIYAPQIMDNLNDIQMDYIYALIASAINGHLDIIRYIAENCIDINISGNYVLQHSAINGHLHIIKYLIEVQNFGNKINKSIALYISTEYSQVNIVEYLIRNNAIPFDAISTDILLLGAKNGNFEIVKYSIEHGADIHVNNNYVLLISAEKGYLDITIYLVSQGIDINHALQINARYGNLNIIRHLVELNTNIKIDYDLMLIFSAFNGHIQIIEYLIDQGVDITKSIKYALHLFPFKMAKIFFVIKLIYIFYFSTCNILLSFFVI